MERTARVLGVLLVIAGWRGVPGFPDRREPVPISHAALHAGAVDSGEWYRLGLAVALLRDRKRSSDGSTYVPLRLEATPSQPETFVVADYRDGDVPTSSAPIAIDGIVEVPLAGTASELTRDLPDYYRPGDVLVLAFQKPTPRWRIVVALLGVVAFFASLSFVRTVVRVIASFVPVRR